MYIVYNFGVPGPHGVGWYAIAAGTDQNVSNRDFIFSREKLKKSCES